MNAYSIYIELKETYLMKLLLKCFIISTLIIASLATIIDNPDLSIISNDFIELFFTNAFRLSPSIAIGTIVGVLIAYCVSPSVGYTGFYDDDQ